MEYVAVRAGKDECATPEKLVQNYVVCELSKKLDILLGFIKTHLKSKMIVFFTSCAQVPLALRLLSHAFMYRLKLHGQFACGQRCNVGLRHRSGMLLLGW